MFSLCLLFKRLNPHIIVPREEKREEENLKIGRGILSSSPSSSL
jgi:hypothetical protein